MGTPSFTLKPLNVASSSESSSNNNRLFLEPLFVAVPFEDLVCRADGSCVLSALDCSVCASSFSSPAPSSKNCCRQEIRFEGHQQNLGIAAVPLDDFVRTREESSHSGSP